MHTPSTKNSLSKVKLTATSSIQKLTMKQPLINSNRQRQLENNQQYRNYLCFKKKLLQAMLQLDPLAILQSGIFEEYEAIFVTGTTDESAVGRNQPSISDFQDQLPAFQSKLNRYELSDGVKVTQLERRSRSCERISDEQNIKRRLQTERNTQFVLFASALRIIGYPSSIPSQGQLSLQINSSQPSAPKQINIENSNTLTIDHLQSELFDITQKNKALQVQLNEYQAKLQQQRLINASTTNDRKDKELEFLLKEKQLSRKLQEARQEIEALRGLLEDSANVRLVKQEIKVDIVEESDRIANLKEKVAVEGRIRWALSRAWGAELQADCH